MLSNDYISDWISFVCRQEKNFNIIRSEVTFNQVRTINQLKVSVNYYELRIFVH